MEDSYGCVTRRDMLLLALAIFSTPARALSPLYPQAVAGIKLPETAPCRSAAEVSRSASPPFLYNHALRTYIFGALHMRHHALKFNPEIAFIAALVHDLGLLSVYERDNLPFEVDSANAAERLAKKYGLSEKSTALIWNATAMHDMRWSIVEHQAPEVILVASGATIDVVGPDPGMISPSDMTEVIRTLPRLGFKAEFKKLLTAHCLRQPGSQNGTWLDDYCCTVTTPGRVSETAEAIDAAPFSE